MALVGGLSWGAVASAGTLPRAEGSSYGDRWLVILASNRTPGEVPPGVGVLQESPLPHRVETLSSTEFKGLMPCFEVVVGSSFAARSEALAFSRQLGELGVDHYVKNAGRWVGSQPRIEAYCAGRRAAVAPRCSGGARFVEEHVGRTFAHLGLDPAIRERILENAPTSRPLDEGRTVWAAPLSARSVEDTRVGEVWTVARPGGTSPCTVTGFVALARGTPHFSWDAVAATGPGCGEPEVFAELGCSEPGGFVAGDGVQVTSSASVSESSDVGQQIGRLVDSLESWSTWRRRAEEEASSRGVPLSVETRIVEHSGVGEPVFSVWVEWTTGDGWDTCGGDDLHLSVVGLFRGRGVTLRPELPPTEIAGLERLEIVSDSGGIALWIDAGLERRLLRPSGSTECAIAWPYCDCGC